MYFTIASCPLSLPETWKYFPLILTLRTWWGSWTLNSWKGGALLRLQPLEFSTLPPVHTDPPATVYHGLSVSTGTVSRVELLLPVNCDSLCTPVSLVWGQQFALWPQFSDGSKKSGWFSVSSTLFLLWGLPISFMSEWKPELLCPSGMFPSFFEHFLVFRTIRHSRLLLYVLYPRHGISYLSKKSWLF